MSTYTDASLIYYPSGYKAGKAYSLKPTDGSGDLTFTRASSATRVNESGLIESVATGVPRIDYTGGGCGKLLLEPQRTNLWPYSRASLTWLKSFWTTTDNYALSPNGTVNAFRAVSANNSGILYLNGIGTTGVNNTLSVYAKSNTGTNQNFRFFGNGNSITSGEFVATTEWQRFTFTYNCTSTASGIKASAVMLSDLLFSDFQHEAGDYATSVIPTTTTAVTRVADGASKSGISSLIGQTEGTLYAEFLHNGNTTRIIAIGDNSTNNRLLLSNNDNKLQVFLIISGSLILSGTGASSFINGINKVAVRYNSGDIAFYLNGVQQITSSATFTTTALSNLFILSTEFAPNQQAGLASMQSAMVFLNGKSNAELATLTTI